MQTRTFENLIAWQKAHQFVVNVYRITRTYPASEQYGLISQFQRAAVSISANIAEGYKRMGKADKLRFLNISQGSLEECRNYVILSHDIEYISDETFEQLLSQLNDASRLLNAYCEKIQATTFANIV